MDDESQQDNSSNKREDGTEATTNDSALEMFARMNSLPSQPALPYEYHTAHQADLERKFGQRPLPLTPDSQNSTTVRQKSASVLACEEILDRILDAINAHDFSLEAWNQIAPNLRVAWGVLNWYKDRDSDLPLPEWLQAMKAFAQKAPHFHFEVWNRTTVVDEQAGTAESLMNIRSEGVYPGIVRTAVSGFSFARTKDGRWEAIRNGAFPGSGLT